jgi:class 3 adenylate cyclase/TolB-like protein
MQKLSVILAADVVGYSRLMGVEEKATLAALTAHRCELWNVKIDQYNGRIIKLIGDGILVEFLTVEDAVLCSVEIQAGMVQRNADISPDRRITFRIGINIGDILFQDDDVYGDGVNVAARIEGIARPGGISVSSSVRDTVGNRLGGICFEDAGEQELKNIARPIRIYNIVSRDLEPSWLDEAEDHVDRQAAPRIGASPKFNPNRTLVAVSKFVNLSGDPDEEYFAAGITEDVVMALSRFSRLNILTQPPQSVELETQTCYSLEGSVRRSGQRVRVNAILKNFVGEHVWAQKYDFDLVDVFLIQDELARSIPAALSVKIEEAERQRVLVKPQNAFSAYDFYLRGRHLEQSTDPADARLAEKMFQAAITADASYARGYLGLAWLDLRKLKWNMSADLDATLASAFVSASKARELAPMDADVHWALGVVYLWRGEAERAIASYERGRELAPNNCDLLAEYCDALGYLGCLDDAIRIGEIALRLNPSRPDWYCWNIAAARFLSGDFEKALKHLEQMTEFGPAFRLLAATYAQLGRPDEAREAGRNLLKVNPGFSIQRYITRAPYRDKSLLTKYVEGLRLAGLPE